MLAPRKLGDRNSHIRASAVVQSNRPLPASCMTYLTKSEPRISATSILSGLENLEREEICSFLFLIAEVDSVFLAKGPYCSSQCDRGWRWLDCVHAR